MTTDDINYTKPIDQIEKLKSQNLIIEDEVFAQNALSCYGYSNLIKSYRDPYVIVSEGKKVYRSGITFNQITSLYILDKKLRNAVMAAMIDLEEHIKETAADVIASSFGVDPADYLCYRHYRNKRRRARRFSLSGLINTMHEVLQSDKDPVRHYREEHGIVPPWILFKNIYFSTIANFIVQFKEAQQVEMVNKLYSLSKIGLSAEKGRKLMLDTLFICLEYRNIAAHGGRTYNHICESALRKQEIFGSNNLPSVEDFSLLLFVLRLFRYQSPFRSLYDTLNEEVNRHCQKYPQDATYLGQILNVDIVVKNYVYISSNSNKYHIVPHCSGIKDAKRIDYFEAQKQGYVACKRCAADIVPIA